MRVVAKIGTASITDDRGVIDGAAVAKLSDEVAALRGAGHEVIVVSSGAVAAGVAALGMTSRPTDIQTLQAISAAGQSRLVEAYNRELPSASVDVWTELELTTLVNHEYVINLSRPLTRHCTVCTNAERYRPSAV